MVRTEKSPVESGTVLRPGELLVALYRGSGLIGKAIRWQTRSGYAHAALARVEDFGPWSGSFGGAALIEAMEGKGVRRLLAPIDYHKADWFRVALDAQERAQVWGFAEEQVGKGYDYTMVLRFVSRRQESRKSTGKWFCSELVFAAFASAGVDLLARTEPWEVSPGLLSRSPYLEQVRFDGGVRITRANDFGGTSK